MLPYANLTKSVGGTRKFCPVLVPCRDRTGQDMGSMSMGWDQFFFLWDGTGPNFYFVGWDRTKFLFCGMGQDQILILWDGMRPDFFSWDGTGREVGAALMGSDRTFVGQDVPSWSFGQPRDAVFTCPSSRRNISSDQIILGLLCI